MLQMMPSTVLGLLDVENPSSLAGRLEGAIAPLAGGFALLMILVVVFLQIRRSRLRAIAEREGGLDPHQVHAMMMANPPLIVDLRSAELFGGKRGHLRGALNIPFPELSRRLPELRSPTPRPILLVDEKGALSRQAAPILKEAGYVWVYILMGGIRAWRAAKLPVYHLGASRES